MKKKTDIFSFKGPRPFREIRAVFNERTVRVYQAFQNAIALPALHEQTFVEPFKFQQSWASWIKPSFLWCMKRTDWGKHTRISSRRKKNNLPFGEHEGDTKVLGIDLDRKFFDKILSIGQLTHYPHGFDKGKWKDLMKNASVYIQWDPEKTIEGDICQWKSIQIGLKTKILREYALSIERIEDMTEKIEEILSVASNEEKIAQLPDERPYPVSKDISDNLQMISKNDDI